MKRYQKIYDDAVSKRYILQQTYANDKFSSPEIHKFEKFKKIKKDIYYFYLIACVVVAVVLLIICTKHNDLFVKIWLMYLAILALNTILMVFSLELIKQIKENKATKARSNEIVHQDEAKLAATTLAKTCICMMGLEYHNSYLNYARKNGNLDIITKEIIEKYIQIVNQANNNDATNDDYLAFYQEILTKEEKESSKSN